MSITNINRSYLYKVAIIMSWSTESVFFFYLFDSDLWEKGVLFRYFKSIWPKFQRHKAVALQIEIIKKSSDVKQQLSQINPFTGTDNHWFCTVKTKSNFQYYVITGEFKFWLIGKVNLFRHSDCNSFNIDSQKCGAKLEEFVFFNGHSLFYVQYSAICITDPVGKISSITIFH